MQKKNKKGSALVLTLMVLLIFTILAASLMTLSLAESRQAIGQEKRTQAYYLAKSGVEMGLDLINDNISELTNIGNEDADVQTKIKVTVSNFCSNLNGITESGNKRFEVDNLGYFTLKFENNEKDYIKVISTGNIKGAKPYKSTANAIIYINYSQDIKNPDTWVISGEQQRNRAVKLYNGKKILLEPPNGNGFITENYNGYEQTHSTSAIYFTKNNHGGNLNLDLAAIPNTAVTTFDAKVVCFKGRLVLIKGRGYDTSGVIKLSFSDGVAGGSYASGYCGFENYDYYKKFLDMYLGRNGYTDPKTIHNLYGFDAGAGRYGIVYFGENVNVYNNLIESGIYYFPQEVSLNDGYLNGKEIKDYPCDYKYRNGEIYYYFDNKKNLNCITNPKLIKVNDNDPIKQAVEKMIEKPFYFEPGAIEWSED